MAERALERPRSRQAIGISAPKGWSIYVPPQLTKYSWPHPPHENAALSTQARWSYSTMDNRERSELCVMPPNQGLASKL